MQKTIVNSGKGRVVGAIRNALNGSLFEINDLLMVRRVYIGIESCPFRTRRHGRPGHGGEVRNVAY